MLAYWPGREYRIWWHRLLPFLPHSRSQSSYLCAHLCPSLLPPTLKACNAEQQPDIVLVACKEVYTALKLSTDCCRPSSSAPSSPGAVNVLCITFAALRASGTCILLALEPTGLGA